MLRRRRNLLGLLISATGVILTVGNGNAAQNVGAIEARIEVARQQLLAAAKESNSIQTKRKDQIAQWYNWSNWPNWPNGWRNW